MIPVSRRFPLAGHAGDVPLPTGPSPAAASQAAEAAHARGAAKVSKQEAERARLLADQLVQACSIPSAYAAETRVVSILNRGAKAECSNSEGWTPLTTAASLGLTGLCDLLISKGACVSRPNRNGSTPLLVACLVGHVPTAQLLLDRGASLENEKQSGASGLHIACEVGCHALVELLLQRGAKPSEVRHDALGLQRTALWVACAEGHASVAELLISKGAAVDQADRNACTPLLIACQQGHLAVVKVLLGSGAELECRDAIGCTPLYMAVSSHHLGVAALLLNRGANPRTPRNDGTSPLYIACQKGFLDMVELLTTKRPNTHSGDLMKQRLPEDSCPSEEQLPKDAMDHMALLKARVEGADVNQRDKDGFCPLYVACNRGHLLVAKLLISKGADVNVQTNDGVTPLETAVANRYRDVCKLLIPLGARIGNVARMSAEDHAFVEQLMEEVNDAGAASSGEGAAGRGMTPEQAAGGSGGKAAGEGAKAPAAPRTCSQCGASRAATKLFKCGRCKVAYYCSPACQSGNWAAHKKPCKELCKAQAAQGKAEAAPAHNTAREPVPAPAPAPASKQLPSRSELMLLPVRELRAMLAAANLSSAGLLEKAELVDQLVRPCS